MISTSHLEPRERRLPLHMRCAASVLGCWLGACSSSGDDTAAAPATRRLALGEEGAGEIILVSSRDPSVSRWRLGPGGALELDAELTFAEPRARSQPRGARAHSDRCWSQSLFMSSDGQLVIWVTADFSATEPVELSPDGSVRNLVSGAGTLLGIVRIR